MSLVYVFNFDAVIKSVIILHSFKLCLRSSVVFYKFKSVIIIDLFLLNFDTLKKCNNLEVLKLLLINKMISIKCGNPS